MRSGFGRLLPIVAFKAGTLSRAPAPLASSHRLLRSTLPLPVLFVVVRMVTASDGQISRQL